MPKKKIPRKIRRKTGGGSLDERIEHFSEEVGNIGKRMGGNISGRPEEFRRLYRSGNERILGGVCGGVAEYFCVDPLLIRLLWVFMSLAWGAGIILYIISWIIIPRNPRHKW